MPLSVKRLGKDGRNIGLTEIGHTVIVMTAMGIESCD
jgi:hypothetical protein